MSLDEWVQVALAIGTIGAALLAYMAIRRDSRRFGHKDSEDRIKELARIEQEPLKDRVSFNDNRISQLLDSNLRIESMMVRMDNSGHETRERLASVEALQRQHIDQLTMSLMKQLHQPDPRRAVIDNLLEQYMEGTITDAEIIQLKKFLVKIRNFEPAENQAEESIRVLGFPVFPGEQTNAAILLGTMDLVSPARLASYGHSVHRAESPSPRDQEPGTSDRNADND